MTAAIPPDGASWIKNCETKATSDSGCIYTYTIYTDSEKKKTVTVQFKEPNTQDIKTRELAHIVLLKQMHEIGKKNPKEDPFQVGTTVTLKTDQANLRNSTKATIEWKKKNETTGFYYTSSGEKKTADGKILTDGLSLRLQEHTKKHQQETMIQRCEQIRCSLLSSLQQEPKEEGMFGETQPSSSVKGTIAQLPSQQPKKASQQARRKVRGRQQPLTDQPQVSQASPPLQRRSPSLQRHDPLSDSDIQDYDANSESEQEPATNPRASVKSALSTIDLKENIQPPVVGKIVRLAEETEGGDSGAGVGKGE